MKFELTAKDSTTEVYEAEDGKYAVGIIRDNSPRGYYRVVFRAGKHVETVATRCTYARAREIAETWIG